MCLVAFAVEADRRVPLALLSNRDETFDRDADPMHWWPADPVRGTPSLLAGRDRTAGGTWLGLTRAGRLALVTNVREPRRPVQPGAPSRGHLVPDWLSGADDEPLHAALARPYAGFNFVGIDLAGRAARAPVRWASNRAPDSAVAIHERSAGLYAVSNAALDTPWPKVVALKRRLATLLQAAPDVDAFFTGGFEALADRTEACDADLPSTHVPLARERQLSAACIRIAADPVAGTPAYGTRCSTLVLVVRDADGCTAHVTERRFAADGTALGDARFAVTLGI